MSSIIQVLELLREFKATILREFQSQTGRASGHFWKKPFKRKKHRRNKE